MKPPEIPIIDTHTHIGDSSFDTDRTEVLQRAADAGVSAVIAVGENMDDARRNLELAEKHPMIRPAAGLYPTILDLDQAKQMHAFIRREHASLVAIGMTREMGAMMAAIIMAGRTGAAFAAQLGTMQVNEEIDALKTLGVSPMEFLVLPRMLALVLMMPLLCIYADLMGIFGGFVVGVGAFDITFTQYFEMTEKALNLRHISIGVVKSGVFGIIIAVSGCLRGMQCGRSANDVGNAATSAVVTAIVWIIVADGLFAVITNVLKI